MTDSDITGNIIADCGMTPQKQDIAEAHDAGCTCECCCLLSETNCEDNIDQCETPQTSGGKSKMRSKLTPILANCALLLAVVGFSSAIVRAGEISRNAEIRTDRVVQEQIADVLANDISQADPIVVDQNVATTTDVDGIEIVDTVEGIDDTIASSTNLIDDDVIDVGDVQIDIENVSSAIEPAKADGIVNTSVNGRIVPTIQS
jgi:hypothetical protein